MKLLDMTEVQLQFDDLKLHKYRMPDRPTQQRSKGTHLTDVLRYLHFGSIPPALDSKEKAKQVRDAAQELDDKSVMNLRMVLGLAWESFVVGFYPDLKWQPGELVLDGIAGSPDGYSCGDYSDVPVIEEFKYTHKSCRMRLGEEILKDTLWMWQLKSYVHMYDETIVPDAVPHARLHVLYGNGDYERPFRERYLKYLIEFDEAELESFWGRAVLPNKERAMKWKREQEDAAKS